MNINTAFSKHLRAEDIGTARPVVTIDRVGIEKVGDDEKPVLYFSGKDKGLVLNRTNSNTLIDLLGTPETDEWAGCRILLYVTKVDFQGKRVPAIRIEAAPPRAVTPVVVGKAKASSAKPEPESAEDELMADDIGF